MARSHPDETVRLTTIIGGGQALGTLESGKKALVWGGLPGETVRFWPTKRKSSFVEGIVTEIIEPSPERIAPRDPDSYLSTSPWQIMDFAAEQRHKAELIDEAFRLHHIDPGGACDVFSDGAEYGYRNKIEYSFWYDTEKEALSLAFFKRGSSGKVAITETALAAPAITKLSRQIVEVLNRRHVGGRQLKTLLIRCSQTGQTVWQLYVKDKSLDYKTILGDIESISSATGGEIIYSNPKSPASVITERLAVTGDVTLEDTILGIPFSYPAESFFQVNLPVYQQALSDMKEWIPESGTVLDLYSGVGSIGLTIGGERVTLVEINEAAVAQMRQNIARLGREDSATAVLAPSEAALKYIDSGQTVVVDPPRAGLHPDVVDKLLEIKPHRIIYLSCNPVTQARDIARLQTSYKIIYRRGYNFFPHTPHIEHLAVLDVL